MPINIVKVYEILQRKSTVNMVKNILGNVGRAVKTVAGGAINKTLQRLKGAKIYGDSRLVTARAKWQGLSKSKDWRVRLTIPNQANALHEAIFGDYNPVLEPIKESRGIFWPLTPSMVIQHSANYNALAQTHSNYPFQAYQNSQVDQMNIIGEFPVQNQEDAKHWVATVHFLRTVTKMFYGKDTSLRGNPPPILHLNGYGDHMFQNVPVVINTFNLELKSGIDYMSTEYETTKTAQQVPPSQRGGDALTWAPTLSNISVLVTPVYSRNTIKNFSLQDFARGKLSGSETGIGFI